MQSLLQNKRFIYINSTDSNTVSGAGTGDFTYRLEKKISNGYTHCCVLQAQINKTYYLLEQSNCSFTLAEGLSQATVSLPLGNYTRQSFVNQLQIALNAASPNKWTYTVGYNNSSNTWKPNTDADIGKLVYTVSGNTSQPSFIFGSALSGCWEEMGFSYNTTNIFISGSLTSNNVIKLVAEDTIFIHSDLAETENDDVLQEIYNGNTYDFSFIHYQCTDLSAYAKPLKKPLKDTYRFTITDEYGSVMNMNGLGVVLTIAIWEEIPIVDKFDRFISLWSEGYKRLFSPE